MDEAGLRRSLRPGIAVLVAVNAGVGYAVVTGDELVLVLLLGAACLYLLWAVITGPGEDVGRTAGRASSPTRSVDAVRLSRPDTAARSHHRPSAGSAPRR